MTTNERAARHRAKKMAERLALAPIPCACGCGDLIPPLNSIGTPSQFKLGHNAKIEDTGGRFQKGQEAWNKGRPCSPETKAKLSNLLKGRISPNKGKIASPETREKLSISHKGQPGTNKGISPSPEVRTKISRTLKGRKHPPERIRSGANHSAWQGGASTLPYGPEFTRRFKKLIRERDGNKCQRCGKTRKQNGRSLEIHHIDHDKMNNDPTNLTTVCGSCNTWLSYHRDEASAMFPKRKMLL